MYDQLYPETAAADSAVTISCTAAPAAAVTSIKGAVLAQFKATEPVLRTLVARYADVAIDCSTPKGLAAAKEARHDMRENGRFVVQRAEKAIKDEVNGLKSVIASEAERLVAIVQPTETLYDEAIKAREAQIAAEKAEREAKEAARVAAHRANIAKLASYVTQAQGKTSAQILTVINGVSGIDILPEQWEEFAVGAEIQKTETLDALQALFHATKTAEDEAAAREAQRLENERIAAELAEQARVLAEQRAELERQLAEVAAAKKAEADRIEAAAQAQRDAYAQKVEAEAQALADAARQAAEDEANRLAQEAAAEALQTAADATPPEVLADAYTASEPADTAEPYTGRMIVSTGVLNPTPEPAADIDEVAAKPWALPAGPITFADLPSPSDEASLTLGAMNERFAGVLTVSARGLATLGFTPLATKKAATLFSERQFQAICDALVEHIGSVCESVAA